MDTMALRFGAFRVYLQGGLHRFFQYTRIFGGGVSFFQYITHGHEKKHMHNKRTISKFQKLC